VDATLPLAHRAENQAMGCGNSIRYFKSHYTANAYSGDTEPGSFTEDYAIVPPA